MKLHVLQNFSWAHRGCDVRSYEIDEVIDTDDTDLIEVAAREGWVEPEGEDDDGEQSGKDRDADQNAAKNNTPPANKASIPPLNKAHTHAPKNKSKED